MPHLELGWQPAAIIAVCVAVLAAALIRTRRARLVATGRFAGEAALLFGLFALWQYAGSFALLPSSGGLPRARWLWHAERLVHLPNEVSVQRPFLPHPLVVEAFNLYYAVLHFPVLIGTLIWLFGWHRGYYRHIRTTVVLFTAASLLVQFIPVAPPRMLPGTGLVDTAAQYGQSVYGSLGLDADQYSAMPSVHVGWALIVAIAVITASRSRWRWAALALSGPHDARRGRDGQPLLAGRDRGGGAGRGALGIQRVTRAVRIAVLTHTGHSAAPTGTAQDQHTVPHHSCDAPGLL